MSATLPVDFAGENVLYCNKIVSRVVLGCGKGNNKEARLDLFLICHISIIA